MSQKRIVICTDVPDELWEVYHQNLQALTQAASRGKFAVLSAEAGGNTAKLIMAMLQAEEQIEEFNSR